MNWSSFFLTATTALVLNLSPALPTNSLNAKAIDPDPRDVTIAVSKLLEQMHYTKHPLDRTIAERTLRLYLETLDYNHLFFTQKDIDDFEKKYLASLDDDILVGDLAPAMAIYDVYKQRVEERIAKNKAALKNDKFDFTSNKSIEVSRQKAPWPKDEAEADQLWHDRLENELLTESLSEHPLEPPITVVTKRYDRLLHALKEQDKEDIEKFFLNAIAQSYDPHSEYFTPADYENFSMSMRLSLVGIGALLRSDEGYAKIVELLPGGPAETEGSLKPNDKITAVAQGNGPFVDVIDMKVDKVVALIRGKAGTVVRLQVIPAGATDPSKRKVITIVRNEVKLTEQEARAEIVEHKNAQGEIEKIGWITLPSFYADMTSHAADAKSTTKDVRALLNRLNKEGISSLVIDLRKNGGGSLEEAINLTGLFIPKGPVVQAKDSNKHVTTSSDKDPVPTYAGPLVVLTSHISASASEIFAGALQDYGRAVIVGDKNTFGKGTVQTMIEVGRAMSPFGFKLADAGALKLTIQKFYRPSGASTQLKGVESDIVLPSRFAHLDLGEASLKYPLPYDEVKPADYKHWEGAHAFDLSSLRKLSEARVKNSPEFHFVQEDINRLEEKLASNKLSLNLKTRKAEIEADKKRAADRKAERLANKETPPVAYQLTLKNINKPQLERVVLDQNNKSKKSAAQQTSEDSDASDDPESDAAAELGLSNKSPAVDPIKEEAIHIASDLAAQQQQPELVNH